MRFRLRWLLGFAASVMVSQSALAGDASSETLQRIEDQMSRLGISGVSSDVSCADFEAASTDYQAYMNSHPDDAEAKQVSGQEPNIPAVTTLAQAENDAERHFDQMNAVRTGNGLASLSPTDGLFPLQEAVTVVCADTSHPSVPHTLAFAAYVAFTSAAGDDGPFEALNAPPPAPPAPPPPPPPLEPEPHTSYPTAALTAQERGAIGDAMRECWTIDGAEDVQSMSVVLSLTVDATGTVRNASVAPVDRARADTDPVFLAFAERAVRAALDDRCSSIPLPPDLQGEPHTIVIRFSP